MLSLKAILSLVFFAASCFASSQDLSFIYNGFRIRSVNLSLGGLAEFTSSGLLKLSNGTDRSTPPRADDLYPTPFSFKNGGHAFYPTPFSFKNSSNSSTPFSFSTSFVFVMHCEHRAEDYTCHGSTALVIAPTLSAFLNYSDGNQVVTVQIYNSLDRCNVGIYLDQSMLPGTTHNCYNIDRNAVFPELSINGLKMQVWVDYSGVAQQMNVTLAPVNVGKHKPMIIPPLLSLSYNLSSVINKTMYVGFSSKTYGTSHYILGWSFRINGQAEQLDLRRLPKLPWLPKEQPKLLTIGLPLILICSLSTIAAAVYLVRRQKKKFAQEMEDWELEYGPHRFNYKDLYVATNGFRDNQLLGRGGFGKVYRGMLPVSQIEIAVKRVSHESTQGLKEFVAEIVSLGRLRHRNLASLLGYCRRRDELLLVYDYMPNGSLDKYLYNQTSSSILNWSQRFRVIKGVASGLLYLHEKWEQVVVHRDVKPSNVLLDNEWNARLGDFGLARLYNHGSGPHATKAAGTFGYLAPEHARTGKATTCTDVYAFGAFMLEVACGRRPIMLCTEPDEDLILVNYVFSCWNRGAILEAIDPNLGCNYVETEAELVLKLGLLCSQSEPTARPNMQQLILCLEDALALPELLPISSNSLIFANGEGFPHLAMSNPPCMEKEISQYSSVAQSLLSGGR